ncbi:hypothetical protein AYO44_06890 [Planctomycetaceae bacterium SCGC AG-212-F19]|nr:hypothetical protein AYO44_06890 [Planctomycetaceae bacterium SCGC AG-212-F19]
MTKTTTSHVTFAVNPVEVGRELLPTEKPKASIEKLLGSPIEACDNYHADVVEQPGFHSLIAAAHLAYHHHFPLVLSPDVIWLTIAQGLANHVNNNAEKLRPQFVPHQGKMLIQVRRDDFVKGSPENPWAEVWPEFSSQIKQVIGPETHGLIVSDFSTTGPTERAASEVVLMDCVQSYFSYRFVTLCGIPEVMLQGNVEDWEKIHQRVERLEQYDLKWWTDDVLQITDEFVAAAKGHPNPTFWKAIYKQQDDSGGPHTTGWLVRLLPYLKQCEYWEATKDFGPFTTSLKNPLLGQPLISEPKSFEGITDPCLPSSASQVPFVWEYLKKEYDYQFLAGVLTIEQDKDSRAIRPRIGWAVREARRAA